jgi:hypothetical protein
MSDRSKAVLVAASVALAVVGVLAVTGVWQAADTPAASPTLRAAARNSPAPIPTSGASSTPDVKAAEAGCTTVLSPGAAIATALASGATVCLRDGSYPGFQSSASGWTLKSYPGEQAIIDGDLGTGSRVVEIVGSNVRIAEVVIQNAPDQWGAGLWVESGHDVTADRVTLRWNHSFGAKVTNARNVHLKRLDVYGNDTGVEATNSIAGFELTDSAIHDHSTMVSDDSSNARGANATSFYKASGPAVVARNKIWNARAESVTYGEDGGAFEVFASHGITFEKNRIWDTQNVMEQGTDGEANTDIVVRGNIAWKPESSTAEVRGRMDGVILRACQRCSLTGNSFYGMDNGSFFVVTKDFTAGVANAHVEFAKNAVEQAAGKAIWINDWTGISIHENTYYLVGTSSVGFSSREVVIRRENPTRP